MQVAVSVGWDGRAPGTGFGAIAAPGVVELVAFEPVGSRAVVPVAGGRRRGGGTRRHLAEHHLGRCLGLNRGLNRGRSLPSAHRARSRYLRRQHSTRPAVTGAIGVWKASWWSTVPRPDPSVAVAIWIVTRFVLLRRQLQLLRSGLAEVHLEDVGQAHQIEQDIGHLIRRPTL